jgi:hypothetical protein
MPHATSLSTERFSAAGSAISQKNEMPVKYLSRIESDAAFTGIQRADWP